MVATRCLLYVLISSGAARALVCPPVTPTTPEMPTPETFTEASAHAVTSEPLAITPEIQTQPAPQDTSPATPDILKDAKAS